MGYHSADTIYTSAPSASEEKQKTEQTGQFDTF